jgi:hypothetical protein
MYGDQRGASGGLGRRSGVNILTFRKKRIRLGSLLEGGAESETRPFKAHTYRPTISSVFLPLRIATRSPPTACRRHPAVGI